MLKLNQTSALAAATSGVLSLFAFGCGGSAPVEPPPAPAATATPTTPPPKTPQPVGSVACSIGKGSDGPLCHRGASALLGFVEAAIDGALALHPEIFDLTDESEKNSGQYRVLDLKMYLALVLDNLRAAGLCADLDYTTLRMVQVKNVNDFSEDFDVLTPDGKYLQRGPGGSYRRTCSPSSFPVDPDPSGPPPGTGCGKPYPPPLGRFGSKIHVQGSDTWELDSTPLIVDNGYCAMIGYTDGRSFCPVRIEGAPDRKACENWRTGRAADTHKPGPTWTRDGKFCTGPDSGCDHHPVNPYELTVYRNGGGHYKVCASNNVCGELDVYR